MPQVIFSPAAICDLQRLRDFLHLKNSDAAKRAAETIKQSLRILSVQPRIGRPVENLPNEYHELLIDFGDSGYVARYRVDAEIVTVLAVRHQKEVGY